MSTSPLPISQVLERLELDEDTFPNLLLSVVSGGHMFYTRADACKQFHADPKALYQASPGAPQR